jgi:ferrous iron transport protein B
LSRQIIVGLVGQPNVGKSTLFNVLTRGNAIVTNWPGTTVERSEAVIRHNNSEIKIIDLPGIYGLSYLTPEERITRKFITEENPDVIVVLADSTILERTLYLVIEILELTGRVVVAVTKVDEAHSRGVHVNYDLISKRLGVPVVPVSAIKGNGIDQLLSSIVEKAGVESPVLRVEYGELEAFINAIEELFAGSRQLSSKYPPRWLALKFLEGDVEVEELARRQLSGVYSELCMVREEAKRRIGQDLAAFISISRMRFIREKILKDALIIAPLKKIEKSWYRLFYNPFTAPLLSLGILLVVFLAVFIVNTGFPLTTILDKLGYTELASIIREYSISGIIDKLFTALSNYIVNSLGESPWTLFLVNGLLGGVASVIVFIPLILIVMMALGALEDSGLLPRLAIGVHLLLNKAGLSGHALLPLSISMGCNVPGVMSTRAVPSSSERLKLILLTPFIPCQARLVVLLAIATAIGGFAGALLVPFIYVVSFIIVFTLSYIIHRLTTSERREEVELLLEIPPVHKPYLKVVWWFTWHYLKHFITKAGTVILIVSIASWLLQHTSLGFMYTDNASESIIASASRSLSIILRPLGVSGEYSWIAMYAVIMGFLAKELVLSTIVTATGASDPIEAFKTLGLSTPSAISLALFISLYIPCLATVATIHGETRSWKYTILSIILMLIVAYSLGVLAFHIANILLTIN